jgi:GTP-binding protein
MAQEMRPTLPGDVPAVFISSVSGYNLMALKDLIWEALK